MEADVDARKIAFHVTDAAWYRQRSSTVIKTGALLLSLLAAATSAHGNECGELYKTGRYGPYDWKDRPNVGHVEIAHFGPSIEALQDTEWNLAQNIGYLLHAAPNHPRALDALVRFGEKFKSNKTPHLAYPIGCWFDRAILFRPKDTVVRVMYAQYLVKQGRKDDGLKQLEAANFNAGENGFSHYNIGLMYMKLNEYSLAAASARRARELDFPRTDLMDELIRLNRWTEPDRAAASPGPSASSNNP